MRSITFENEINGLSYTFSTQKPLAFLESFDGCSCGSEVIAYKPIAYDGQRFISSSLSPRTIQFTVNFGGIADGKYSRTAAMVQWSAIQKVFVPGQTGKLTWTDGTNTRFIKCRCNNTPLPTPILSWLFRASFELTADDPRWYDSVENVVTFPLGGINVNIMNDCGISVPFIVVVPAGTGLFGMVSIAANAGMVFSNSISEDFVIDTGACTVTTASGKLVNNMLTAKSEFFDIAPGDNVFSQTGSRSIVLKWRKAYMGVY